MQNGRPHMSIKNCYPRSSIGRDSVHRPVDSEGRVKYGLGVYGFGKYESGVFQVRLKYESGVFWFYGFRINPTGLELLFLGFSLSK